MGMKMIISTCCKDSVYVETTKRSYIYFVCHKCEIECITTVSFLLTCELYDNISGKALIKDDKMPKFSADSFTKLSACHSELQVLFYEVIKNFDCQILEGYRNQEDQEKAFKSGTTQLHFPHGKHNHQPSMAVDASPYPVEWNNPKRFYWFAGYVMGIAQKLKDEGKMTHAIRYGGDWNMDKNIDNEDFKDLVHFELV